MKKYLLCILGCGLLVSLTQAAEPSVLGQNKQEDPAYQREMGFVDDPSLKAPQMEDQFEQNRRVQMESYLSVGQGEMENLWDAAFELEHFQNQIP